MGPIEIIADGLRLTIPAEYVATDRNINTLSNHYQFQDLAGNVILEAQVAWRSTFSIPFENGIARWLGSAKIEERRP